ncbi:MAG: hypothetical protein M1828_001397 [Chrysothrix sp. TS-e1954]|nr:MAG: hypothetical protein M1828_001397 [Chrysothrix sp. TS-e1954]
MATAQGTLVYSQHQVGLYRTVMEWWHATGGQGGAQWSSPTISANFRAREQAYAELHDTDSLFEACDDSRTVQGVTCLDYSRRCTTQHSSVTQLSTEANSWEQFKKTIIGPPSKDTHLRLICVEELSARLVSFLGALFCIHPDFMIQHTHAPGFGQTSALYASPSSKPFLGGHEENWCCVNWYRPVLCNMSGLKKAEKRSELASKGIVEWEKVRHVGTATVPKQVQVRYCVERDSSVLRHEWPAITGDENTIALQERLTVWVQRFRSCHLAIIFCDPVPAIHRSTTHETIKRMGLPSPLRASFPLLFPESAVKESDDEDEDVFRPRRSDWRGPLYSQRHSRSLVAEQSETVAFSSRLGGHLCVPMTTVRDEILQWSLHADILKRDSSVDPLFGLLGLLGNDTIDFTCYVMQRLHEIEEEALSESLLQQKLPQWRSFIRHARYELPKIQSSLLKLASTLYCVLPRDAFEGSRRFSSSVNGLLTFTKNETDNLLTQCEKAEASLRTELSLLESRRGIAEAESVTKLTELAFLFLPLTLAASLFSMQIDALQGGTSTGYFAAACAILLTLAYSARLMVRSSLLHRVKTRCVLSIRSHHKLGSDQALSARQCLTWLLHATIIRISSLSKALVSWETLLSLGFLAAMISPLIVLWTTHVLGGLKGIYSAVFLIFALAFVAFILLHVLTWRDGALHLQDDLSARLRPRDAYRQRRPEQELSESEFQDEATEDDSWELDTFSQH